MYEVYFILHSVQVIIILYGYLMPIYKLWSHDFDTDSNEVNGYDS